MRGFTLEHAGKAHVILRWREPRFFEDVAFFRTDTSIRAAFELKDAALEFALSFGCRLVCARAERFGAHSLRMARFTGGTATADVGWRNEQ